MSTTTSGTLIEGFGDEAVYGLIVIFTVAVLIAMFMSTWVQQRTTLQPIHRENQQTVNTVREEIQQARESTGRTRPNYPNNRERQCPICLGQAIYAIETNCGHAFCGQCMITYWRHGNWISGLKCPICRSQVTLLLEYFTAEEQATSSTEKDNIVQEVNSYNRRYSGQPIPLMDRLRDLPTLLRHLWTEFFTVGGLVLVFRLRIIIFLVIGFLYLISPLDLIPEAAFGFLGLIDDLFVLFLLAIYVSLLYRQFVQQRAANS